MIFLLLLLILFIIILLALTAILLISAPSQTSSSTKTLYEQPTLKLSIIIPAYNEKERLPPTLDHTIQFCDTKYGKDGYEIIIVDDASKDGTHKIVEDVKRKQVRCVRLKKNKGKGGAVAEVSHAIQRL